MENLKIRVSNEAESREAQELFFELGYSWSGNSKDIFDFYMPEYIVNWNNSYITIGDDSDKNRQEITLPELRDMVVLKRNDVGDATHINFRTNTPFLVQGSKEYFHLNNKWILSDCANDLKPIEKKEMKEYLLKTNGGYKLITAENAEGEGVIEVPEGANFATEYYGLDFWKSLNSDEYSKSVGFGWAKNDGNSLKDFLKSDSGVLIVWQRESLNDKVASAEQYRQAEALPFIDDEPKEKHSHYKKDISHLNILDVYRVLELFDVYNPCLQHAIKKLLCAGQRGAKDTEKDIQEAIDTLIRYKQMREEDNA